jgi:phage N-6-adenine-methyltransferase
VSPIPGWKLLVGAGWHSRESPHPYYMPGFVTPAQTSSACPTWATPQATFDALDKEFGFVLDAAALSSSAKCRAWYGPDQRVKRRRNAFDHDWALEAKRLGGAVWLNPPYGKDIGDWMERAAHTGLSVVTVCLVPARTDTKWFHQHVYNKAEVRFVKGRLRFGDAPHPAPFPSLVCVYRP